MKRKKNYSVPENIKRWKYKKMIGKNIYNENKNMSCVNYF